MLEASVIVCRAYEKAFEGEQHDPKPLVGISGYKLGGFAEMLCLDAIPNARSLT
jgi:hypothetical protein